MWIRGPGFDGFWFLSGMPFGAVLTVAAARGVPTAALIFWIVLAVQTGHTIAPMALAWSHDGFRALMLRRPIKFIVVPGAILIASTAIGAVAGAKLNLHFDTANFAIAAGPETWAQFENPFLAMVALYGGWNAYHFGKQAFGIMSIYRRKNELADDIRNGVLCRIDIWKSRILAQRQVDLFYCCAVVWATMAMPFVPKIAELAHNVAGFPAHPHPFLDRVQWWYLGAALALIAAMLVREWMTVRSLPRAIFIMTDGIGMILVFHFGLWGFAIIGLNHWLAAIGIASHVHGNYAGCSPWWFALAVMGFGAYLFWWLFCKVAWPLSTEVLTFSVAAVGFRLGLGFYHFLQDRWLYRLSDPLVRETIGKALLA